MAQQTLNIYNWADYMPQTVIDAFEKKTGIHINYTEYDSNEAMYSKLKSNPHVGYDIIFPSSYFIARMGKEQMLLKLDKSKLPNFKFLNPRFINQKFDPENNYSIPYLWGATGIVVNNKYINSNSVNAWSDFWQPKYRNQLLLFDDVREVFSIALLTLGYSINETNPERIHQAYLKLKDLLPNVKLFNSEAQQNVYIDEDVHIGMGFNGEINNAQSENANLRFIYPKEGFEIWLDCIAIPKNAPHLQAAYQFINFLLQPEIAKEISLALGFSSPNLQAIQLLPLSIRNNPILNPPLSVMKRASFLEDLGNVNSIYEDYWNKLKIGE